MKQWRLPRLPVTLGTVLAIAAIVLTVWEGFENRRHNRLSVAPRVDGSLQLSWESVALLLKSTGLGPAVVKAFEVYLDGKLVYDAGSAVGVASPWQEIIQRLDPDSVSISANALGIETLLRPGEDITILQVQVRDSASVGAQDLSRFIDRVAIRLRYCSMYNDQCRTTFVGRQPADTARTRRR